VFISLTRLRLRSIRFLPGFAVYAIRSLKQAQQSGGFLKGDVLRDRSWTFWTMTAWDSQASMQRFMISGVHKAAMPNLLHWCDEASVAHWEQTNEDLPSWEEADQRMRSQGRPSKVRNPSPHHANLTYQAPLLTRNMPFAPAKP
jgi:hypothetical protein